MRNVSMADELGRASSTLAMLAEFFRLSSYEGGGSGAADGLYTVAIEESRRCEEAARGGNDEG